MKGYINKTYSIDVIEPQTINGLIVNGDFHKEIIYTNVNGTDKIQQESYYDDISSTYGGTGQLIRQYEYFYDDNTASQQSARTGSPWDSLTPTPYALYKKVERYYSNGSLVKSATEEYGYDVSGNKIYNKRSIG